jgi:uncharacterized protein
VSPLEIERGSVGHYLVDQRYALHTRGDGLVYHSSPFEDATEATGYVTVVLWLVLDVPDTDIMITLGEVAGDGSYVQLTWDILRARYRRSPRTATPVTPGAVESYTFAGFTFFSRRIAKGSRLRLAIGPPNSIYIEKNYNSGGAVAPESRGDARPARVAVVHDPDHASYLELPIIRV